MTEAEIEMLLIRIRNAVNQLDNAHTREAKEIVLGNILYAANRLNKYLENGEWK